MRSILGITCGRGSFAAHFGDHLRSRIICGPFWGSLAVEDHLRSILGITCGRGSFAVHFGDHLRSRIICGPFWGSLAVEDHLRPILGITCGRGSFAVHFGDHLRSRIICGPFWGSLAVEDHLRSILGITCSRGSFAVHFGDHLRSRDHLRLGIICGTVHNNTHARIKFLLLNPVTVLFSFIHVLKVLGFVFDPQLLDILLLVLKTFSTTTIFVKLNKPSVS